MNLLELKIAVNNAIHHADESGVSPCEINVSIQVNFNEESVWSSDVELHYDNDCQASGCVIVGDAE
jgi:hypothetical protein